MNDLLFTLRFRLPSGPITIRAFECPYTGGTHTYLRCELRAAGKVLFADGRVGIPGHQSIDGEYAKEAVTALFCLSPGDTDADFFVDYTPEQLAWVTANGEQLSYEKDCRWCSHCGKKRRASCERH